MAAVPAQPDGPGIAPGAHPYPTGYQMPAYAFLPFPWMMPPLMPFGYPPYCMPAPYGPAPATAAYPPSYYRRRMPGIYIALIVIGIVILIGGAVAAAVLLTGSGGSSFKLGDGTVSGVDIEFKGMVLSQEDRYLVLTGTYDNNTKKEGEVTVSIRAISDGATQLVGFTVPVEPGRGISFEQKEASTVKLSGATLGSLSFSTSTDYDNGYPWDEGEDGEDSPEDGDESTSPSDREEDLESTTPRESYPLDSVPEGYEEPLPLDFEGHSPP